jgi:hypothetical protein
MRFSAIKGLFAARGGARGLDLRIFLRGCVTYPVYRQAQGARPPGAAAGLHGPGPHRVLRGGDRGFLEQPGPFQLPPQPTGFLRHPVRRLNIRRGEPVPQVLTEQPSVQRIDRPLAPTRPRQPTRQHREIATHGQRRTLLAAPVAPPRGPTETHQGYHGIIRQAGFHLRRYQFGTGVGTKTPVQGARTQGFFP